MEFVIIVAFLLGFIVGIVYPRKESGTLKIDHSNPMKDVYRFEVDDLDVLNKKSRIVLRVEHDAHLSQN